MTGGRTRPALLADVFEAFIGALFLDQGIDTVVDFLEKYVFPKVNAGAFSHVMDFKSQLQELFNVMVLEYLSIKSLLKRDLLIIENLFQCFTKRSRTWYWFRTVEKGS